MRALLFALILSAPSLGNAQVYWIEPFASHNLNGEFTEGTVTGDFDSGSGGGLRVFGFFSRIFYAGLDARYDQTKITFDTVTGLSEGTSSFYSGGPLLGAFGTSFRLWLAYHPLATFNQEHTITASLAKREFSKTGWGGTAGLGYWVFRWVSVNIEYSYHVFDRSKPVTPAGSTVDLVDELTVSRTMVTLSFPISL